MSGGAPQLVLDSEEAKNVAVVHKTNQGYSGKDLWKLKQERPELFGGQGAVSSDVSSKPLLPVGYVEDPRLGAGWCYNRDRDVYLNVDKGRKYVVDPATNELTELGEGRDLSNNLAVRGDAASSAGKDGPASKHVIISDLHKAAAAMKLNFSHHDSPAAMFALYDAGGSPANVVEAAAKGLHVRLLPRLAMYRGQWQNDRLETVLEETLRDLANEVGAAEMRIAIALVLGGRLILSSIGGPLCFLMGKDGMAEGGMDELDVFSSGQQLTTHCVVLEEDHLGVFLAADAVRTAGNLSPARIRALARSHLSADRPRASCLNVLLEARRGGAEGPLVAIGVRFAWSQVQDPDAPAAKRQRTTDLTKVRVRHILLRHTGATAVGDRGKPKAKRPVSEAEEMLLRALPDLGLGGPAAFTAFCKKNSDCDTSLRGGDLAGDLGWIDKDPAKNRKVPAPVVRAAFHLNVGQLSDVVASDRGVHLILRSA